MPVPVSSGSTRGWPTATAVDGHSSLSFGFFGFFGFSNGFFGSVEQTFGFFGWVGFSQRGRSCGLQKTPPRSQTDKQPDTQTHRHTELQSYRATELQSDRATDRQRQSVCLSGSLEASSAARRFSPFAKIQPNRKNRKSDIHNRKNHWRNRKNRKNRNLKNYARRRPSPLADPLSCRS